MTVAELLAELRGRDIRLRLEGERIKVDAPTGALTDEIKARIAERRDEVIAFLRSVERAQRWPRGIVPLNADGARVPIFAVPGHNGDVFCFVSLVRALPSDQPFFGVRPPGLDDGVPLDTVAELADYAVSQIREVRPDGPYLVAGYCAGGGLALEIAARLHAAGADVRTLVLLGCPHPTMYRGAGAAQFRVTQLALRVRHHLRVLLGGGVAEDIAHVRGVLGRLVSRDPSRSDDTPGDALTREAQARTHSVETATMAAIRNHRFTSRVPVVDFFVPSAATRRTGVRFRRWARHAGVVREHVGPDGCTIDSMLRPEHAEATAALLRPVLDTPPEARAKPGAIAAR
jgi:thioesterase domain-containing protein